MSIFTCILDLLFPKKCPFCRKLLQKNESLMCAECAHKLPYTTNGVSQTGDFFDECISALYYEDEAREAILRYKFNETTAYADCFSKLIAECVKANLSDRFDLITWVPLSAKRLKKRGYDQAQLLAEGLARELGMSAISTLVKHRDVPAQSGIGGAEKRRANISGCYMAHNTAAFTDKRVLLIDDVATTCSTLSECSRVLLSAGAENVVCATLARVR